MFGDAWIRTAIEQGHPLFITLLNAAPIAQTSLAGLGHELAQLERSTSIDHLVVRLKDPREFDGAVAEVTVASKARRAGFSVELPQAKSDRVADIRVVNPPVYIEVTALDSSVIQKETMKTAQAIWAATIDDEVLSGGRIFHVLPDSLIKEYQIKIRDLIAEVKATGQPAQLQDGRIIDLRFAAKTDEDAVATMQAEGYAGLAGPSLYASELYRLRRALQGKAGGFPDVPDGSGIVVLWDGWAPVEVPNKLVAHHFAEILAKYPRVAVAALLYPPMTVGRGKRGHAPEVDREDYGIILHDVGIPPEEILLVQRGVSPLSEDDLIRLFSGTARS